jgi:hypothetical protein
MCVRVCVCVCLCMCGRGIMVSARGFSAVVFLFLLDTERL